MKAPKAPHDFRDGKLPLGSTFVRAPTELKGEWITHEMMRGNTAARELSDADHLDTACTKASARAPR